jgi:ABC-type multidrug transport system fused ATPase/permease subunit
MIKKIIKKFWKSILWAYFLFNIESIAGIILPYFLGKAIDDIVQGRQDNLYVYILILSIWIVLGFTRRFYDTRVFSSIHSFVASNVSINQLAENQSLSKISARVGLSQSLVDFYETDIVVFLSTVYGLLGSLYMIFIVSQDIFIYSLLFSFIMTCIIYRFKKKITPLTEKLNNSSERTLDYLGSENTKHIQKHFKILAGRTIKVSDSEATNYLLAAIPLIGLYYLSLSSFTSAEMITVGTIVSIYQYLNKFVLAIDDVPYLVQQFVYVRDVQSRI